MKKLLPPLILVMSFFGFLAVQSIWDMSRSNAQNVNAENSKDQMFESLYQEIKLTTIDQVLIEPKSLTTPIVVINFWASWCLPCLKEFPSLVELKNRYKGRITVIGINGDEEEPLKAVEKMKTKFKLDFHHVIDPDSAISDKFLVTSYPFSLIYVKGKLIHTSMKGVDFVGEEILKKINSGLKDSKP